MEEELLRKLNKVVTEHGIRIDAFVPLLDKIDKLNESLMRIEKSMYFIEDRQKKILKYYGILDKKIEDIEPKK